MATATPEPAWVPPSFDISRSPTLISQVEIPYQNAENFVRAAKWCPDGSSLLAQSEDSSLYIYDLPSETLNRSPDQPSNSTFHRTFSQPSPIVDFVWYPGASLYNAATFCFVASVRECPVKLLDASDGRLRASYKIVDHRERQISPHSLSFNLTADKLYCGYEDAIEVFDVNYPGEGTRLPTTPSKKTKEGLKGIISALAFSPSYDIYAAGSLSPAANNIAVFTESGGSKPVMFVDFGTSAKIKTGITELHFNPIKPHMIYASCRRQDVIYNWDLRGDVSKPLKEFHTSDKSDNVATTNQKLRFDVDLGGKWLAIGNRVGFVSFFDLDSGEEAETVYSGSTVEVQPTLAFRAHDDAVGSVGFHPTRPLLCSVSGARHFDNNLRERKHANTSDDSSAEEEEKEEHDGGLQGGREHNSIGVLRRKQRPRPFTKDSSTKIWTFDPAEIRKD